MVTILTEASGSLTSGYILKAIKQAGFRSVASDIDPDIAGRYLAEDFIQMPRIKDVNLWEVTLKELIRHQVNVVIPSLDETLLAWAQRKQMLSKQGISVIISEPATVEIFQDKWRTYQFFESYGIPTPRTSLEQDFSLVKPRLGRGSIGVLVTSEPQVMDGMISQEVVEGKEYTIDVFCDVSHHPIYIVPRQRLKVKDGKSMDGIVIDNPLMESWVREICRKAAFIGPINMQCFLCADGSIKFIEINPRLAGGMALGFAATENWIKLAVDHFIYQKEIIAKPIKYGMKMLRYYDEIFV